MSSKKPTKDKIKEKAKSMKRKLKSKVKKVATCLAMLLLVAGCATSEPASRATIARYDFGSIHCEGNSTVTITLGDGAIASADSTGSTETMTSSPTNDVKPQTSIPVNKAGAGQSVGSVLGDAVAGLINGASDRANNSTATVAPCEDGSCNEGGGGACADGSCNL